MMIYIYINKMVCKDVEKIILKYIFRDVECCFCPMKAKVKSVIGTIKLKWSWCCCGCITDNIIIQYKNGQEVHMG